MHCESNNRMTQKFLEEEQIPMCFRSKTQNLNKVHDFSIERHTEDYSLKYRKDNRLECNARLQLQAILWDYMELETSPKT